MHRVIVNHDKIITSLSEHSTLAQPDSIIRGKRRYNLSHEHSRRIFFILEGDFLLKMRVKNEEKMLNILSAPYVVDVTPALDALPLYLERVDYGRVHSLSYDRFWQLVREKDLLDDTMSILSGHYSDLLNYITTSKSSSYEQVISLIERWQRLPSHLKKRFSALYLIENSSWLSRSSICRVLKELKDRGELKLDNGRFRNGDGLKQH
ncbi:helix-turn-helix domain-containing protein [Citrobacter rodentium NBRC 105723 = DSM 16636]|uniref:Transcriptional regulator n=1 Tax=Citrobacter rodentium TaxID=67825 RepID=A0A482PPA4_CITRO|nr:transcriptional regulator [Citrobacter rodentium]UHO33583.1 helix-turn-helix domain-containing protein [Citrobacter rodentium NBRC 105723 = DSM 16636]QBY31933.1 transcriptional regulator [Citrobacter rodentium]HAT8012232.1 transcriptional regulator [Citrobacter rodentium NBRC 105723 = DSM 16636]HAT8017283.1 transcriptional regulator [Citrobacter rodentium]